MRCALLVLGLLSSCYDSHLVDSGRSTRDGATSSRSDAGSVDAQLPDGGLRDARVPDARFPDGGLPDARFVDAAPSDAARSIDVAFSDARPFDAGPRVDARVVRRDGGPPPRRDTGPEPDAFFPMIDAGFPDAGPLPDTGPPMGFDAGAGPCDVASPCGRLRWETLEEVTVPGDVFTRESPGTRLGPAARLGSRVVVPMVTWGAPMRERYDLSYAVIDVRGRNTTAAFVRSGLLRGSPRLDEALRPQAVPIGARRVLVVAPGLYAWIDPARPTFPTSQGRLDALGPVPDFAVAADVGGRALIVQLEGLGRLRGPRTLVTGIGRPDGRFERRYLAPVHEDVSTVGPMWILGDPSGATVAWLAQRPSGLRELWWTRLRPDGGPATLPEQVDILPRAVGRSRAGQGFVRNGELQVPLETSAGARLLTIGPAGVRLAPAPVSGEGEWLGDGFLVMQRARASAFDPAGELRDREVIFPFGDTESSLGRRVPCEGVVAVASQPPETRDDLVGLGRLLVRYGRCLTE